MYFPHPPCSRFELINGRRAGDDSFYGDRVCEMASNQTELSTHYSRRQVINVWRPLRHTVTNSPLAVMDVRTLRWEGDEESGVEADVSVMANVFGFGYGVHHNRKHRRLLLAT